MIDKQEYKEKLDLKEIPDCGWLSCDVNVWGEGAGVEMDMALRYVCVGVGWFPCQVYGVACRIGGVPHGDSRSSWMGR